MRYILSLIFSLLAGLIFSINVHGHLTQDTIWSPDNNPYIVDQFLYVDAGVTLTILPGVQVRVADATDAGYGSLFQWHGSNEPTAKMLVVYGKIVAIGTEAQPISFDNLSGDPYRRWGGIVIMDSAPQSVFRYCHLSHQYNCQFSPGRGTMSMLTFLNGIVDVRHCIFYDINIGIYSNNLTQPALVYACEFSIDHNMTYYYDPIAVSFYVYSSNPLGYVDALIAKCTYSHDIGLYLPGEGVNHTFIYNRFLNMIPRAPTTQRLNAGAFNQYGNYAYNSYGAYCKAPEPADTAYCRRNVVVNPYATGTTQESIIGSYGSGTAFVSDNYAEGNVELYISGPQSLTNGYYYNNKINTINYYSIVMDCDPHYYQHVNNVSIFNNVFTRQAGMSSVILGEDSGRIFNNTFSGFQYLFASMESNDQLTNNIAFDIGQFTSQGGYPSFPPFLSYNSLSFVIPFPEVDGIGNIYTEPMLVDTLNYDFHLQAGSPCIDVGTMLDNMPAFDADYHFRVAGNAPDMGAYEYGSQYIGGIQGYVYDAQTLQPLDCVEIKISGKLPEFSDSLGCFPYPSGAGTYTVTVKRFDYADLVIPNVVVSVGDTTWHNIPMQTTVANDEQVIPVNDSQVSLYNYPNPFNPSTTISFIIPKNSETSLTIYNAKGQVVKTLLSGQQKAGHHSIVWNGTDIAGKTVSSGIYLIQLNMAGKLIKTGKVILVK